MQTKLSVKDKDNRMKARTNSECHNPVVYDKKQFVPFKDERDHLGRIIGSVSFTSIPNLITYRKFVRKLVVAI